MYNVLENVNPCTFCIMVYRGAKNIFTPESLGAIDFIEFNVAWLNAKFNRDEMFDGKADSWLKEKHIWVWVN